MSLSSITLGEALQRYKNAKRRALYWSGTPSFSPYRTKETQSSRLDEKYELAMCDCKNWEAEIERLTSKRPPHYDPKKKSYTIWSKIINNLPKTKK